MRENYSFGQIKNEIERKKATSTVVPLTAEEYENTEQKPMTLKDH